MGSAGRREVAGRAPRWRWAAIGVVTVLPIVWVGCTARTQTAAPAPEAQVRPRSTATLTILSPVPGAVIKGTALHVQFRLVGGEVVPQTSTHLTPDKGHIHLSIDGKVVSMTYGLDQDVQVTKGPHLLQGEFVATDHFPFNPRVVSVATFTVE